MVRCGESLLQVLGYWSFRSGRYKLRTVGYEMRDQHAISGLSLWVQRESHTGVHLHTEKQVRVGVTISQATSLLQVW